MITLTSKSSNNLARLLRHPAIYASMSQIDKVFTLADEVGVAKAIDSQ